jgi:hypothetical protein
MAVTPWGRIDSVLGGRGTGVMELATPAGGGGSRGSGRRRGRARSTQHALICFPFGVLRLRLPATELLALLHPLVAELPARATSSTSRRRAGQGRAADGGRDRDGHMQRWGRIVGGAG